MTSKDLMDSRVKAVGAAIAIATFVFGVIKFTLERDKAFALEENRFNHDLEMKQREYELREDEVNRTFWDNRAAKCIEATSATGRIVAEHASNPATIQTFQTLYYGPLSIFENQYAAQEKDSVEAAMVNFKHTLDQCQRDPKACDWESSEDNSLGHRSVLVAHACTCLICSGFTDENKAKKIRECDFCPRRSSPEAGR